MGKVLVIFKKEFKSYFNSPIAYIFITVYLVLTSWLFFHNFFIVNQAEMRFYFGIQPWVFLFFIPAVTMRLWAEERKLGTIEVLLTFPVKIYEVVIGKFLASFVFLALTISLSFTLPLTVKILGSPDFGVIICGYLGLLLMGAAYLAIGCFISSLTENQIIAFILSCVFIFLMLIIGESMILFTVPKFLVPILEYLGLGSHFESIGRGIIDSRDIVYYLSIIVFFLILNATFLEQKK